MAYYFLILCHVDGSSLIARGFVIQLSCLFCSQLVLRCRRLFDDRFFGASDSVIHLPALRCALLGLRLRPLIGVDGSMVELSVMLRCQL